jgi:hypothetical protein
MWMVISIVAARIYKILKVSDSGQLEGVSVVRIISSPHWREHLRVLVGISIVIIISSPHWREHLRVLAIVSIVMTMSSPP